ncbi:hypothetical protein ACXYRQ_00605 [Mycoplasma sp. 394]
MNTPNKQELSNNQINELFFEYIEKSKNIECSDIFDFTIYEKYLMT